MPIVDKSKDIKFLEQDDKAKQVIFRSRNLNIFLIKYYNWLVCLTAILIITVGYFLLIQPKIRKIYNSQKIYSRVQEKDYSTKKQNRLAELAKTEQAYNEISKQDKEKIEKILPNKTDEEKLIAEIESIVLKNGLILTSMLIQPVEEKKNKSDNLENKSISSLEETKFVKIFLTIVGADYVGLKNLLKTIENNNRMMDVKSIKYDVEKGEINLDLIVYYFS